MAFLYLDPMIYVPYELSLRKKKAITLKKFYVDGGERLPVSGYKPKRMPNKNYIYLEFTAPQYMDVSSIEGTDKAISFVTHFELMHDEEVISVKHLQHLAFAKPSGRSRFVNHFNIKYACPALYGIEGKRMIDEGGLSSGRSKHREIIRFGLDGDNHEGRKWVIETFDLLEPCEQLRHGTIQ